MLKRRARKVDSTNLAFEHLALLDKGSTLTLAVPAGSSVAIIGPTCAGKSRLLNVVIGNEKPTRGEVFRPAEVSVIDGEGITRRDKPGALAKDSLSEKDSTRVAEVLSALGLWEVRNRTMANLGAEQQVAARFIEALVASPSLILTDGEMDLLDPWTRDRLWQILQTRLAEGATLVFTTNIAALAEKADLVIVLKDQQVLFSDTPSALTRSFSPSTVTVATHDHPGTLALASPFEVEVTQVDGGTRFEASEGQQLAAKLLLEGYGDVRYIILKAPTFDEALRRLVG